MSRFVIPAAGIVLAVFAVLLLSGSALAAGAGQPIVELQNWSGSGITVATQFKEVDISGTDNGNRKQYKFQRMREGKNFSYVVANLTPLGSYGMELNFVEHEYSSSGKRIFNGYLQSARVLNQLDIYSRAGKNRAYQRTFTTSADATGRLTVQFRSDESGCKDNACISTIRVYATATGATAVEISAASSRNNMSMPVRHTDTGQQNTFEALLGRLGSRFSLDLAPQRLAARFSSLGTGTGDLADLVLALSDGANVRCLPFTDRYPAWESMSQTQTMTSQTFACSSPATQFSTSVRFWAPFYPGNDRVSGAPFVYVDVTVTNNGAAPANGSFILAMPHKRDFASASPAEYANATEAGLTYSNSYTYNDETTSSFRPKAVTEGIAVPAGEAAGVDFRGSVLPEFSDFSADSLWGYASPGGYPDRYNAPASPLFTFYPRGYSGAVWSISGLAPASSVTRHFVLAGFTSDRVLTAKNSSYDDRSFRFRYSQQFAGVQGVINYALTSRWAGETIEEKTTFFDSTVASGNYLSLNPAYRQQVLNLMACGFQSYLVNTWWARSDSGRDWFSVWEGSDCRYHSTVDVEYNHAWFYFEYWPELLKTVMNEWVLYSKTSDLGTYLSHDMGWNENATGQAYTHDMPVEENTNYILLLYRYWKSTGDAGYVKSRFSTVRELVDFIIRCDENNNGLPDLNTSNTLDQGSPGIQVAKDQSYLGVKCMAAYRAAGEMADLLSDETYSKRCWGQVALINQTLAQDLWLSDHFAVCLDGGVKSQDADAYSIYASNGLLYLLGSTRTPYVTTDNIQRFRADLQSAVDNTLEKYGCTHSSYNPYNEWVSQNLWRDQAACYLGVTLAGGNPLAFAKRYWSLENFFGRKMNGGFWDVVMYPGGSGPSGASARAAGGGPAISTTGSGSSGYSQSLGYYPRGAATLGLIDAVAGIVLDIPNSGLYYRPTTYPLKVPVFSRADWANPDPSRRVPTLYFANSASGPTVTNRDLLPRRLERLRVLDVENVKAGGHALSPDGDGVNDSVKVCYDLPIAAKVSISVWDGATKVRTWKTASLSKGHASFTWDGKSDKGAVVKDGIYTALIEATPGDTGYKVRPASAELRVNNSVPNLATDWYLAEGFTGRNATGGDFEEYVLIQNPNSKAANINVTFMVPGGATTARAYQVAPRSRFTITVDNILPDAEVSTYVHADENIAVERAMYFNGRRAGHDSIGVTKPGKTWYLAEGYTAQGFDEYVLIQNPGQETARVTATFMTPNMGNVIKKYTVSPHARYTIHVDDVLPAHEVSTEIDSSAPVVVERAQYLNNMKAGTCSIAAASTSRTWYLAEGYTDQGFEEYVLVQNPGKESNNITVTFMEKSGANTVRNYYLPPACRFTIGVGEILPKAEVSVRVRAENPILVERAMYWNNRSDGHDSIGTPTPDSEWYLPEGYTAKGFETWILVQNPGDTKQKVTFTFMQPSGVNTVKTYEVGPRSRYTVGVNDILPDSEVSTRVSAAGQIIVERAVYFNNRSGGTDTVGIRGY